MDFLVTNVRNLLSLSGNVYLEFFFFLNPNVNSNSFLYMKFTFWLRCTSIGIFMGCLRKFDSLFDINLIIGLSPFNGHLLVKRVVQ